MIALLTPVPAHAAEGKGMPQLDFGNPLTVSQIGWLVVIFLILYLLLSGWALPKVGAVIDQRAARIGSDLESARAAKQAADHAAGEARDAGRAAHAQAQSQINDAVAEAKQQAAAAAAVLNEELNARISASELSIAQARRTAMQGLREVVEEVAATMVERLSGKPADRAAVDQVVGGLLRREQA